MAGLCSGTGCLLVACALLPASGANGQICSWTAFGAGAHVLHVADLGSGARLFAGGSFPGMLAAYDGFGWASWLPGLASSPSPSPCGGPLQPPCVPAPVITAMTVFPGPGGPELIVGGTFALAGGSPASGLARFDGSAFWPHAAPPGKVLSLCVYDSGQGPQLYAGVTNAGNTGLFVWNGANWSIVGGGLAMFPGTGQAAVRSLLVHDDGSGPRLIAAGTFHTAGGFPARRVAVWDGIAWSPAGIGIGLTATGHTDTVHSMVSFDDGAGPSLYAAGNFKVADGQPVNNVARWNGTGWTPAGSGIGTASGTFSYGTVTRLHVFEDGTGMQLYAAGLHSANTPERVFRFDGLGWNPVPGSSGGTPSDLAVFTDGSGPALFAALPSGPAIGRLSCQSTLGLRLSQPLGPGGPVWVSNANLMPGREYFNIFSVDPCPGGPGAGPLLGLCSNDLSFQVAQLQLPIEQRPFHFTAPSAAPILGSCTVGPLTVEGVCLDLTGGALGLYSSAIRFTIQ